MITDVGGIKVGHWTDADALTGCTVILPPQGTIGSVSIPGNAPATRETDVIAPGRRVDAPNAILLTGGSAFGLAAADGVMRWLEERGIGHQTPVARVPIVPTAAIFDLWPGSAAVRPGAAEGYAACEAASGGPVAEGNVGAGTGATVGMSAGPQACSKGGLGTASARAGDVTIGALAVVNAVGDVTEDDGTVIAGARAEPVWDPTDPSTWNPAGAGWEPTGTNTTICCVATDGALTKVEVFELARAAEAGLGRAIRPVHTMFDGDAVFALATGMVPSSVAAIGPVAADVLAAAVRRAVRAATDVDGVPALGHR